MPSMEYQEIELNGCFGTVYIHPKYEVSSDNYWVASMRIDEEYYEGNGETAQLALLSLYYKFSSYCALTDIMKMAKENKQ